MRPQDVDIVGAKPSEALVEQARKLLRWFPAALASVPSTESVYFVDTTKCFRSAPSSPPTMRSLSPSVYRFAVSMTLPPASAYAVNILRHSSTLAPHPQLPPKVIVPRNNFDARRPLRPKVLYFIGFLLAIVLGLVAHHTLCMDDLSRRIVRSRC